MTATAAMRVLVIDDEALARRRLRRMLEKLDGIEVVGEAVDGIDAQRQLTDLSPDAMFLDIRMPGLDGLTLARTTSDLPPIVFTTAYDEFAVEAFEAAAVDYLLKPIEHPRLEQAVRRLRDRQVQLATEQLQVLLQRLGVGTVAGLAIDESAAKAPYRLSAQQGNSVHVFDPRVIPRFTADNKYTAFEHDGRRYLSEESIVSLEEHLGPHGWFRCHRAELIDLARVRAMHSVDGGYEAELDDGQRARVSRRLVSELKRRLGI